MLAGPMLAAVLMPYGILLPLWTGVVFLAAAIPLLAFVRGSNAGPGVLSKKTSNNGHEQQALLHDDEVTTDTTYATTQSSPSNHRPVHDFFAEYLNLLKASSNFRLLLLVKLFTSFASCSSSFLALYITLRTGWTFAEVTTTAFTCRTTKATRERRR